MSLILILLSISTQILKIVGLKIAKLQGSDGRIDKRKIAIKLLILLSQSFYPPPVHQVMV
jgi:hypothetical protein